TQPEKIKKIHEDYLAAGADIVETNTFGGTPIVLDEFGLKAKAREINLAAARLAREAADKYSTKEKPRFVAGSIGPTTKAISVTGGITFEELEENFYAQALALVDGGVDYLLIETCQDTRNVKAAIAAIQKLFSETGKPIPIAVSGTIEPMGTMLAGQSIEAFAVSLSHLDLLYLGLNCATGPEFMTDHIRSLAAITKFPVACVPNAGLPDEDGHYLETPAMVGKVLDRFCQEGWVNLLGGCCGTTAKYIEVLAEVAGRHVPRKINVPTASYLSGVDFLEISDEKRPILVGERTNAIGSRKFKKLIGDGKFDEASEIARRQVKNGAHIIDICLANPDRDELEDIKNFLEPVVQKIRVPLMFDSTNHEVFRLALEYSQGKAILNSINLEDGEERFEKVVPLAKQWGAALVVGTIDEDPKQGMGVTRQRKLEIAQRSYKLLTEKYKLPEEDIYFDCLVFPCATGDEQYIGSAKETVEGIRLVKQAFPKCKTVLGISNVSFGLPPAGREVLNAIFLHDCVKAGLDLAIVNTEQLVRYASIPEEEIVLAKNLLYNEGKDPIQKFADHFRERKEKSTAETKIKLPLEERLASYIIEGSKDGLFSDLDEALKKYKPLEIINGPLMKGMDEVGRLFNNNELIVAEVLQSAESMKAAVSFLEPHMEKNEAQSCGKVILATVKGDVHDIGKNLVDIILSNNGFEVINLGIKVPSEVLIAAIKKNRPDMIGLSGLLVKSAQQMELTAGDLSQAGIDIPILVGGAALTKNFTDKRITQAYASRAVFYAKDAMEGLDLAKKIRNPKLYEKLKETKQVAITPIEVEKPKEEAPIFTGRSPDVEILQTVPAAPDFSRHTLLNTPLDTIWSYINLKMLLGRHLGVKGSLVKLIETGNFDELRKTDEGKKAFEIWNALEELKKECRKGLIQPKAMYQFFPAASDGEQLHLLSPDDGEGVATFNFPRQKKRPYLCLADYIAPVNGSNKDNLAMFVVTAGSGIRALAEAWKNDGKYLKCHMIQALAIETAEGYAEFLHSKLRSLWGFSDDPTMKMMDRFQAKYRGKRYSFGYPACPDLEFQHAIWRLLHPEDIGVELTEEFMMDPEASVSAIVLHHPQASYFAV
ncbi:MAG: methionine synthase, partial [Deltaproteobacteria bacterium]|nr:methionine synthase [Deltaproteobacteria bacterium]